MTRITISASTQAHFKLAVATRADATRKQLLDAGLGYAKVTTTYQADRAVILVEGKPQLQYTWEQQ